jgi:hypothetical protein
MTSTAPPMLSVTTTFPRDPRLYASDHNTFLRESLRETSAIHHERHMPWHFERFAAAKYGYVKRSIKYQRRKDKLGLPPLVSPNPRTSGQLRRSILQFRTIAATSKRSRLIMRLPFKGGTGRLRLIGGSLSEQQRQILHRFAELESVAPDESQFLAKTILEKYTARANAPGVQHRTRNRPPKP